MFPTMHIQQEKHIEATIEMELMFLSAQTQSACLELIMGLDAEVRITYLNQLMAKVAALQAEVDATPDMPYLLAA